MAPTIRLATEADAAQILEIYAPFCGDSAVSFETEPPSLNVMAYRIADVRLSLNVVDDARQALYRETQLSLRALVGARELDSFLADKDGVVQELEQGLHRRVSALGLQVINPLDPEEVDAITADIIEGAWS